MKGLYCVYDRVAEEFSSPEVFRNDTQAFRWYKAGQAKVEDPSFNPDDYRLFRIAAFDPDNGDILPDRREVVAPPVGQVVEDDQ